MWKLGIGFVAFAALMLFVLFRAGDKVEMRGEQHQMPAAETPAKH